MPRPPRISGLGDVVTGNLVSSPYICRSCRHLAWQQRLASHQSLRHASSEDIPFREQMRNRIRPATSVIPDPYSGESYLERRRKERALQKEVRNRQEAEDDPADRDFVPKEYTPSETWDGLEHVGHKGHWRDIEPKPEDDFQAFLASGQLKASRPEHFLAAIHQATVEIVTLQQAGKDLKLSTLAFENWHSEVKELLSQTKIEILEGKSHPKFTYPTENTKGIILGWFLKTQRDRLQGEARPASVNNEDVDDSLEIQEVSAAETGKIDDAAHIPEAEEVDMGSHTSEAGGTISITADSTGDYIYNAAEVEKDIVAEDEKLAERQRREFEVQHGRDQQPKGTENWTLFYEGVDAPALGGRQQFLDLKLDFKTELTYFLIRRITQLTGFRIPDPVLAKAKTLRSIYIYLLEAIKPKPKNLAETLAMKTQLASLPNVKIMGRRETPVDKEKAVGRWKVIEAELKSRGLPVLGRVDL